MVKLFYINIFIAFLLQSCVIKGNEESAVICHSLDSILSEIISTERSYPVYELFFFDIDSVDYMSVHPSMYYNKDLADGCFSYKGKIIAYSYLHGRKMEKIILEDNKMIHADSLDKYAKSHNDNTVFCLERRIQTYIIQADNSFIRVNDSLEGRNDSLNNIEKSVSIIRSPQMEAVVKDYVNKYRFFMYNMYIENYKQGCYMSLRPSAWYDRARMKGYFYLNNNLIVLYADEMIDLKKYFSIDYIHYLEDSVPNRKNAPIEYLTYPYCQFYKIKDNNTIESVGPEFENEYVFH